MPRAVSGKWRDRVLLTLTGLLTMAALGAGLEFMARQVFPEPKTTALNCLVLNDASTGVRAIPNTTCVDQIYESRSVEYKYNQCGHRAGIECGPKPPGVFRIVLVGSSFVEGLYVEREKTFAALLPAILTRRTGRQVEVYNEGLHWGTPHNVDLRFEQVLAAQPDMILWVLTPFDIENSSLSLPYVPGREKLPAKPATDVSHPPSERSLQSRAARAWKRIISSFGETRTAFLLQHYLYMSQSQYVKHYLLQDESAGFLKIHPDDQWKTHLQQFDAYAKDIETRSRTAGVPLVAALIPHRAQAAMISTHDWPAGFDPYVIGEELSLIVASHGGTYIDILHNYRMIANPEQDYLPVDGHIDAKGHKIVAEMLANQLLKGPLKSLDHGAQPSAALRY